MYIKATIGHAQSDIIIFHISYRLYFQSLWVASRMSLIEKNNTFFIWNLYANNNKLLRKYAVLTFIYIWSQKYIFSSVTFQRLIKVWFICFLWIWSMICSQNILKNYHYSWKLDFCLKSQETLQNLKALSFCGELFAYVTFVYLIGKYIYIVGTYPDNPVILLFIFFTNIPV